MIDSLKTLSTKPGVWRKKTSHHGGAENYTKIRLLYPNKLSFLTSLTQSFYNQEIIVMISQGFSTSALLTFGAE